MTSPALALELLYLIIEEVLESELQQYQHVFAPKTSSTVYQLLITHSTFRNYLEYQGRFHRLRLWRLLNRIPRQFEPVKVAVGTMDSFTVISIDMSTEKITNIPYSTAAFENSRRDPNLTETFLVLHETTSSTRSYRAHNDHLVYTRTPYVKWGSQQVQYSTERSLPTLSSSSSATTFSGCGSGCLKGKVKEKRSKKFSSCTGREVGDNNNNSLRYRDITIDDTISWMALFPLAGFIRHIQWYALNHDASVWLWKRSTRFFRGANLDLLHQQQFRYILDTNRTALIAWDRPFQGNFRFTESVLNSNVELFSNLLPST